METSLCLSAWSSPRQLVITPSELFKRTLPRSLFFKWKKIKNVFFWLTIVFLQHPQESNGRSWGYEILSVNCFYRQEESYQTLFLLQKIYKNHAAYLNDMEKCSQHNAKWKKKKHTKFITKMWNVISFCNTQWVDICRGRSLERCIPTHSLCCCFVWCFNGCF